MDVSFSCDISADIKSTNRSSSNNFTFKYLPKNDSETSKSVIKERKVP
jgi:hypothetical protein